MGDWHRRPLESEVSTADIDGERRGRSAHTLVDGCPEHFVFLVGPCTTVTGLNDFFWGVHGAVVCAGEAAL